MADTGVTNWPATDDLDLPSDKTIAPTDAGDGNYVFIELLRRFVGILRAVWTDLTQGMTHDLPMGSHKITGLATPVAGTDAATKTYVDTADATKAQALAPTAVKTANYTAAAGELVPVDTTSGAVTVTLPTAPADKTRVGVKLVIQGGTNTVTVARGGTDVFNKTGGSTSLTLSLLNQSISLQYKASGAIWYVVGDDLPLSDLDARYIASSSAGAASGVALLDPNTRVLEEPKVHLLRGSGHTDSFKPSSVVAETFSRVSGWTNGGGISDGTLLLYPLILKAGDVVSAFNFVSGVTGLTRGNNNDSHVWQALFDANRNMLAQSADDTTTAWAGNSVFSQAVAAVAGGAATSYTVPTEGLYYGGLVVAKGTGSNSPAVPTCYITSGQIAAVMLLAPVLCFNSNTGQTTPQAFPFQANAAGSAKSFLPYAYVS